MAGGEEGFIVIRRFMIKQLGLHGVPLMLYARIYGFTVGGERGCYESQKSMAENLGVSGRAIGKALRQLKEKGLVVEVGTYRLKNGRTTKIFKAVRPAPGSAVAGGAGGTNVTERSSAVVRLTSEHSSSQSGNGVRTERIKDSNASERKGPDGFDKYSF